MVGCGCHRTPAGKRNRPRLQGALLLAFAGLLIAVTDLTEWASGGCVAAWQTVIPFNAVLIAVNALIIPGLVLSRRPGPSSAAAPPTAAGAGALST
jgi:hypothetical protein